MNDSNKARLLLEQLIIVESQRDAVYRQQMISEGKAHQAVGESFMLFHLKELQKLLFGG